MKIFCPVWGEKHLNLLDKALGASLRWPKNNYAISEAEWIIVTKDNDSFQKAKEIVKSINLNCKLSPIIYSELADKNVDSGMVLIRAVRAVAETCIAENKPLLMATPDFIYAEGTIDTFKEIGKEKGSCVSIAHIRALPQIMNHLRPAPTNKALMSKAWELAHLSWTGSNSRNPEKRIYRGGVKWTGLSKTQRLVQHYMPSPFFVNFLPKDLTSFNTPHEGRPPGFGIWDHVWPTELINDGRLRYIGASEAAMMVEVTDQDMNVPPLDSPNEDGFFRNHFHNNIQKQFLSLFEGEE